MTEPNENIAPGRGTATRTSESDEGKASGRGIMSLDAVRRLAWTAIVLFIMAIVFAFNHGPILAWLAANHTPLLVGLLQSPLWLVAFLLIVLGLQCWLDIVEDDETPFAIGMHALGIMLGIGWWAGLAALSSHQPADANCYGLLGGCILFGLFAWIMDRRQKAGREAFPRLRDQIADFAVTYIASEEYRKNNGGRRMMDECERLTYVSGEAACNAVDIATALGGGFHVSFPPGRGTMTLIKYFPDGSDVSIEVGDDRAAASNSRFETVEWDIEDGIPQKLLTSSPRLKPGDSVQPVEG